MKLFYVYILKCKDDSFYTGITNSIERRLYEHNVGIDKDAYTYSRRPVELVWFEMFTDPNQAIMIEKKIKGWSKRKKQALIDETLKNFSTKLKINISKDQIHYSDIHGWLYAYNLNTAAPNCYWDSDLRLGICGDWFSGNNAESAFFNAKYLANLI